MTNYGNYYKKRIEMQRKTGISGNILARMGRNEYISIESIEKICCALHCILMTEMLILMLLKRLFQQ